MTERKRKVSSSLEGSFSEMSSALENSFVEMTGRTRKFSSGMTQRKVSAALDDGYDGLVSSLQNLPAASVKSQRKAYSQANLMLIRHGYQSKKHQSMGSFDRRKMEEDIVMFHPDKPWLNAMLNSPANRKHKNQEQRTSNKSSKLRISSGNSSKNELSFNLEQIKVILGSMGMVGLLSVATEGFVLLPRYCIALLPKKHIWSCVFLVC